MTFSWTASSGYPAVFYSTSQKETIPSSSTLPSGPCQNPTYFLGLLHFKLSKLPGSVIATSGLIRTASFFPSPPVPKSLTCASIKSYSPTCGNDWSTSNSILHQLLGEFLNMWIWSRYPSKLPFRSTLVENIYHTVLQLFIDFSLPLLVSSFTSISYSIAASIYQSARLRMCEWIEF